MGGAVEDREIVVAGMWGGVMKLTKEQLEFAARLEFFLKEQRDAQTDQEDENNAEVHVAIVESCPTWGEFIKTLKLNRSEHFATFMLGMSCGAELGYPTRKKQVQ